MNHTPKKVILRFKTHRSDLSRGVESTPRIWPTLYTHIKFHVNIYKVIYLAIKAPKGSRVAVSVPEALRKRDEEGPSAIKSKEKREKRKMR